MALQANTSELRDRARERLGADAFESYLAELEVTELSDGRVVLRVAPTLAREASRRCSPALTGEAWLGYLLALACAFVWSSYSILSRRFQNVPSSAVAGFCAVTAGLSFICHLLFETTLWPVGLTQWAAVAGLGLGPVGLAFYVWDYGVKHGDIRLLGVMSYAAPVLSTVLVGAGFAEPTAGLGLACALIVGGALLASVGR